MCALLEMTSCLNAKDDDDDDEDDLADDIECLDDELELDNLSVKNGSMGSGANTPGSAGSRVCNQYIMSYPLSSYFFFVPSTVQVNV